ncbi:MAG: hypothetical protein F6K41_20810 [Symploca sp. SIO3E6]|nr:hypothetical protein [Caldora sp. SIO3E6]
MRKFIRNPLLLAAVGLISVPWVITTFSLSASSAKIPSILTGERRRTNGIAQGSIWKKIRSRVTGERQKTSGMGGAKFCSITPNRASVITWSDRPLFVWQGTVTNIKVEHLDQDQPLWDYNLQPHEQTQQSIFYGGKPLERGQTYYYSVTYQETAEDGTIVTKTLDPILQFEVMDSEGYSRIAEGIDSTMSVEELAWYFAEETSEKPGLFYDFVRVLFTPGAISPNQRQELTTEYCNPNSTN